MPTRSRPFPAFRPSLPLILLFILLATLWVAGGASRPDAAGQVVVRAVTAAVLATAILFCRRPALRRRAPTWLLLAAALMATLQLVPLPPALWEALPGRAPFSGAAAVLGEAPVWRPWSIVPGATVNALASLIVPVTTLVLLASAEPEDLARLPGLLLAFAVLSTLLGLLQFSGGAFNNPFLNDTPGTVSSSFANRNHLALFLAMGCLLVPVWVFARGWRPGWRVPTGIGLGLLFALTILATGSRAGTALGALAIAIGLVIAWRGIKASLARYPRWVIYAFTAGIIGVIAIAVLLSIAADRAVSVDRVLAVDQELDMRSRGFPVVLAMVREYFPMGSGLGGFDPLFRMHEPFGLLKPTFFNHAHNDFLEIVLDTGVFGLLLLLAALGWWVWASARAWRAGWGPERMLPRLGSALLLLVMLASIVDYPARTPMMMAVIVIAAVWLDGVSPDVHRASALPGEGQPL